MLALPGADLLGNFQFFDTLFNDLCIDGPGLFDIPGQQGMVAEDVDQAGISLTKRVDLLYGPVSKYLGSRPGLLQTVLDIVTGFAATQRLNVIINRNPLA